MAFTQQDPVELIARHQHDSWVSWAKSVEKVIRIPEKVRHRWELRFVPFDLLPDHVQEGYRHVARRYISWIKESLSESQKDDSE